MSHKHFRTSGPIKARLTRRDFLGHASRVSLFAGLAGALPSRAWSMDCHVADMPRTLVNVMLQGGADLRFLFMPAPSHFNSIYLDATWTARQSLYDTDYENYQQMFDNEYLLASDPQSGQEFGIHLRAGWLKNQFDLGNVAVVANSFCSRNRRHDQSILNADVGEPELDVLNFERNGWGGRLVEFLDGPSNCVELGQSVSAFNKGSTPGARLERVVHARDMRDIALAAPDEGNPASRRNVLARALRAYYDVRGPETAATKPANWPYHTFFQHNQALREFGDLIDSRLQACLPLPDSLESLQLTSDEFAQQCRNLFDACQIPDALELGVISMNYGGWDSHDNEATEIGANLEDIFGPEAGLATAMSEVAALPYLDTPASNQLVFYFASDFGRQIMANGSAGTDHGRGTYSILLGEQVRGGIYGEMFPEREINPGSDGSIPLMTPGADIEGLTSSDRILAVASDWVKPGAGAYVFPSAGSAPNEEGVDLHQLLPL